MNLTELNRLSREVEGIAINAGDKLLRFARRLHTLEIKSKKRQGLVSEADLETEKLIIRHLKKNHPSHFFLGEENSYGSKLMGQKKFQSLPHCWIIDPLDGTHNFLNGLDLYCVCIGYAEFGEMKLGVVYLPASGECYSATQGGGAFLTDFSKQARRKRLKFETKGKRLSDSLLSTGFVSEKGVINPKEFTLFKKVFKQARGIRRLGSAALDMCFVAKGTFAGFWESGLAPWDTAASSIICQESGVRVSDFSGGVYCPFSSTILAAREPVYRDLKKILRE